MYLKSIELTGFKSFAKKSTLEFTSPISAIVGPNGTGKSNIAESFRFVLGEQSIKSLRGKRGEDLIFNGGGGEARSNRAAVKLTFDNTRKIFSIDFPEVAIERVVHRDGTNEYAINGSQVRLKDVISLLSDAHIGSSGHHIISQGEADKILNASSKERKAMIEDALGLKIYQYKKIESERKLRKTFENISQVEGLRKEIAPHLRFLKKQVEKIEKVESLREELLRLAQEYFKRENLYISFTKSSIHEERKPLDENLKILNGRLLEAKATLERASKENKRQYEILEIEKDLSAARIHKDALIRELGKIEGSVSAEERIIRKQKELVSSEDHKMVRLQDIEELRFTLEEEVGDAEKTSNDYLGILKRFILKLTDYIRTQKNSADTNIALEAEEALVRLRKDKEKIEGEIKEAENKESKLKEKYELFKAEIDQEKDSSRDAEREVFHIMAEENDIISKLNLLKSKEDHLIQEESQFMNELEEIGHILGSDAMHFKSFDIENEEVAITEDRKIQEERKLLLLKIKIRLEDSGVSGVDEVIKEYRNANERDEFLARELSDLDRSAITLKELIKDLETRLSEEFSIGIEKINKEFGSLFSLMFGGGEARINLVKEKKKKIDAIIEGDFEEGEDEESDEDEITEEGLDISLNLPRKKIKGLMMLSGGERALTSIALLFAISAVNPPPFIILDETDAALDEANSKKYGDMVERLSTHSQLILITHNRETMSRAGVIYGVTMSGTGVSKLLSIQFEEAVSVAK